MNLLLGMQIFASATQIDGMHFIEHNKNIDAEKNISSVKGYSTVLFQIVFP
jgi:hypothetical protein